MARDWKWRQRAVQLAHCLLASPAVSSHSFQFDLIHFGGFISFISGFQLIHSSHTFPYFLIHFGFISFSFLSVLNLVSKVYRSGKTSCYSAGKFSNSKCSNTTRSFSFTIGTNFRGSVFIAAFHQLFFWCSKLKNSNFFKCAFDWQLIFQVLIFLTVLQNHTNGCYPPMVLMCTKITNRFDL